MHRRQAVRVHRRQGARPKCRSRERPPFGIVRTRGLVRPAACARSARQRSLGQAAVRQEQAGTRVERGWSGGGAARVRSTVGESCFCCRGKLPRTPNWSWSPPTARTGRTLLNQRDDQPCPHHLHVISLVPLPFCQRLLPLLVCCSCTCTLPGHAHLATVGRPHLVGSSSQSVDLLDSAGHSHTSRRCWPAPLLPSGPPGPCHATMRCHTDASPGRFTCESDQARDEWIAKLSAIVCGGSRIWESPTAADPSAGEPSAGAWRGHGRPVRMPHVRARGGGAGC